MQALNIAATGCWPSKLMLRLSLIIYPTWEQLVSKGIELNSKTSYQDLRRVGSNSSDAGTIVPSGLQLGVGTRVASTYRIGEQGALSLPDNSFLI